MMDDDVLEQIALAADFALLGDTAGAGLALRPLAAECMASPALARVSSAIGVLAAASRALIDDSGRVGFHASCALVMSTATMPPIERQH